MPPHIPILHFDFRYAPVVLICTSSARDRVVVEFSCSRSKVHPLRNVSSIAAQTTFLWLRSIDMASRNPSRTGVGAPHGNNGEIFARIESGMLKGCFVCK